MTRRTLSYTEILTIVLLAVVPLFVDLPYRVNIFLSWEGAYRMSQGQLPFRDFGIPLGGAYWVIPAVFFRIFGPAMISLVKAQVFINILGGLAFRSILKSFQIHPVVRFLSLLVFCISYSFFNFWPWYNHSVIVFELVGFAFLFKFIFSNNHSGKQLLWLIPAAFFVCFSFLTKQDGGGMAFGIAVFLLVYWSLVQKNWIPVLIFVACTAGIFLLLTYPFYAYGFGYWFNHGQAPHTARVSAGELMDEFFSSSQWIKFYLLVIGLVMTYKLTRGNSVRGLINNPREFLFPLFVVCMLGEAAIFQVTSYTPPDNNIFFHSFAFAFLANFLATHSSLPFQKPGFLVAATLGIMIWWSGTYWKYIQRMTSRLFPAETETVSNPTQENIVNRHTYMLRTDTTEVPMGNWVQTNLPVFRKITMPKPTADGIDRLLRLDLIRNPKNLKILNMSELTPLAAVVPFEPERNPQLPLWYHLGVGMFNKQAEIFEQRIDQKYYDLVLFENIPALNNFYPFRVRNRLLTDYRLIDSFPAPRRGETQGLIEVFVKQ